MSIKQNGGVFGRNPTFNDVTIEGQLTFDGDIDINSDLKIDGGLQVLGTTEFENNINVNVGDIIVDDGAVYITHSSDRALQFARTSANTFSFEHSTAEMYLWNGTTSAASINFKNGGDVHVNSGNLVIGTSGKGIDFSATAGTGTSELLDDYEIGQWTPTYTTTGTDFDSITYNFQAGEYVKIGQMVWCSFQFRTAAVTVGSASGNLRVGGLPFTVGSQSAGDTFGPVGTYKTFASGSPQVVSPVNGATQMQVVSQDFTIQDYSIIGTGSNANWLQGDIIYLVN